MRSNMGEAFFESLLPAESVTIVAATRSARADCAVAVLPDVEIILPLEGLIDSEAELAKQQKSLEKTLADLERQIGPLRRQAEQRVIRGCVLRPRWSEQTRAKLAELEARRDAVLRLLNRT